MGIAGNQLVARYKLAVGRRIRSATMVADAKHSWLDALSSAGAMLGLIGVALGWGWADAVAGIVVTGFICHIGWEVTADIAHRLLDGVDPEIITTAETVAATVPGVTHAHARARWTGRTLRVEVEGFLDPDTPLAAADQIGRSVAAALAPQNSGDAQLHLDCAGRPLSQQSRLAGRGGGNGQLLCAGNDSMASISSSAPSQFSRCPASGTATSRAPGMPSASLREWLGGVV